MEEPAIGTSIRPRDISRNARAHAWLSLGPLAPSLTRLQPFRLPPSSRPNPHGRRLADHLRPSADVTTERRIRTARCSTKQSLFTTRRRPPLGLDHACVGRIFIVYRCIRFTFSYVSDNLFDFDVRSPFHTFLSYLFTFPSSIVAPFLTTRSTSPTLRLFCKISSFPTPRSLSPAVPSLSSAAPVVSPNPLTTCGGSPAHSRS